MKKNIVLIGLVLILILAGCNLNGATKTSRTVEVNGQPVQVEGPELVLTVKGATTTSVSEVLITQPENSKSHIEASVDNRLVEKDGAKIVLTTVTIEETVPAIDVPLYVWFLIGMIVILVIVVIVVFTYKPEAVPEPQPEPQPEAVPEPQPEPQEIDSSVYVETFIEEGKEGAKKKAASRFYGIDSVQDLVVLTKNTANRADEIRARVDELKAEIKQLNAEIRQNSGDTFADEVRRERLRTVKSNKNERLEILSLEGQLVETSNDDYAYLLKRLTGEDTDFRKTERFVAEKNMSVTQYDVVWLKKHLNIQ